MIRTGPAAIVATLACWDAWRLLGDRIEDPSAAATAAALLATFVWRGWRVRDRPAAAPALAGALALTAVAARTGPALLQIGAAVAGLAALLWPERRAVAAALALLALPVLPTLDFLLAYPLRRLSALLAAALLRLNGLAVGVEGVALDWRGRLLLFDGPCSGVRMLWAALLLAGLLAAIRALPTPAAARLLVVAAGLAILGNALRAAALFYLEGGFVPALAGPVAHQGAGLAAFALLSPLLFLAARRRNA